MGPARKGMHTPTVHGVGVCRLACVCKRAHTRARRHVETIGREHGAVVEHDLADGVEAADGLRGCAGGEVDAVGGGVGDDLDGAAAGDGACGGGGGHGDGGSTGGGCEGRGDEAHGESEGGEGEHCVCMEYQGKLLKEEMIKTSVDRYLKSFLELRVLMVRDGPELLLESRTHGQSYIFDLILQKIL